MPLTLPTHPIAVVPLKLWRARWFDGVALVIGSIAPDLGYTTYGFGETVRTHNLLALFWWGVPVTLVAGVLIRWAAPTIAAHLASAGTLRLRDYGVLGVVRHPWHVTVLSALLGSFSHIAWDACTPPGYLPPLRREAWPAPRTRRSGVLLIASPALLCGAAAARLSSSVRQRVGVNRRPW